jgi:23S rRNA (guanosine2251-2'-O)-methyltransferase
MKQEFYLILPDIRSSHNVGAMFRTADACGVDQIFLVGYTPVPPRPDIAKVALGAETWMKWKHYKNLKLLIKNLQKKGVRVVALEKTDESLDIGTLPLKKGESIALIVGNEVDGVDPKILELCNAVVHIPMYGKKGSLNVSIAAGIGMYVISQKQKNLLY